MAATSAPPIANSTSPTIRSVRKDPDPATPTRTPLRYGIGDAQTLLKGASRIRRGVGGLRHLEHPEVADHALHAAAALLQELGDVDLDVGNAALADLCEQSFGEAGGQEEERFARQAGVRARRVAEGVRGVAGRVFVGELDDRVAERLAQAIPAVGSERARPGEQMLALRAERAERRVAVVVRLEDELDADHRARCDERREERLHLCVGAEAVAALPRRDADARDESLLLELA